MISPSKGIGRGGTHLHQPSSIQFTPARIARNTPVSCGTSRAQWPHTWRAASCSPSSFWRPGRLCSPKRAVSRARSSMRATARRSRKCRCASTIRSSPHSPPVTDAFSSTACPPAAASCTCLPLITYSCAASSMCLPAMCSPLPYRLPPEPARMRKRSM